MIQLLFQGQVTLFLLIVIAIIISLSFHEFGHAATAKLYGDDTAEKMGRLTLNPLVHIDPVGLLMVVLIGFGFAKPVQTNPSKFNSIWADLFVSAAGPGMNLVLAVLSVNFYLFGINQGWGFLQSESASFFFIYLALINLLLMIFNLLPIGPLDGHYILPYFLPKKMARTYREYNYRYGSYALLGLVALSLMGVPIFSYVMSFGESILPYISFL
ncbi:site-2 protease family protein [Aurantivibrio infirmus]